MLYIKSDKEYDYVLSQMIYFMTCFDNLPVCKCPSDHITYCCWRYRVYPMEQARSSVVISFELFHSSVCIANKHN